MKIGIDIRPLYVSSSRVRGIGVYVVNLIRELRNLRRHEFVLYTFSSQIANFLRTMPIIHNRQRTLQWVERGEWLIHNYLLMKNKVRSQNIAVFHSTDPLFILPTTKQCKAVATVYDVIPLLFQEDYMHRNFYGRYLYKKALSNLFYVNKIITLSYTSREDIHRLLGIPKEVIAPIYLGVDPCFAPLCAQYIIEAVKKKFNIKNMYILYVGGVDHRKNILTLLEAFKILRQRLRGKITFALAGNDINYNVPQRLKILRKIDELGLTQYVTLCGYVTAEELNALYNGAELFCFPSLYEGFGLPIIEAMACGVPVVTSKIPSLEEIAGRAAYLVNPQSAEDIAEGMFQVISNPDIRDSLIKKGFENVKRFSWAKTARETLKIYKEVVNA